MNFTIVVMLAVLAGSPSTALQSRIRKIEGRLMAPCCYTQTIDVHESEIAQQMRGEVTQMVLAGQSDEAIINHYKAIYGEGILAVPDGASGSLVFSIPGFITIFAALALLGGILKTAQNTRSRLPALQPSVDDPIIQAFRARIRDEWSRDL
jgi:cytochrome c-type biogenesis protein CcmH